MTQLNVKIRKVRPHAITPTYGTEGAACFDLYAAETVMIPLGQTVRIKTGIAIEIPEHHEMQIRPRSGISAKTNLRVANSPATIDCDFRGEVEVLLQNVGLAGTYDRRPHPMQVDGEILVKMTSSPGSYIVQRGDRIAQAAVVPIPRVTFVEVDEELTQTGRGVGAFGSTGVSDNTQFFDGYKPKFYFKTKEEVE